MTAAAIRSRASDSSPRAFRSIVSASDLSCEALARASSAARATPSACLRRSSSSEISASSPCRRTRASSCLASASSHDGRRRSRSRYSCFSRAAASLRAISSASRVSESCRSASSACCLSGFSWRRTSPTRSCSRRRSCSSPASLRSARSRRRRCLAIPAASSMNCRRSSGFADRTSSRCPWLMIVCMARPMPVSDSSSWMSSSRHGRPPSRYSLSPERNTERLISISDAGTGMRPALLSMTNFTSAMPRAGREGLPAKMTSAIWPPRSTLGPCSPRTQAIASATLDLPDPFGPTMTLMPGVNSSVVLSANDLNPRMVRDRRNTLERNGIGGTGSNLGNDQGLERTQWDTRNWRSPFGDSS